MRLAPILLVLLGCDPVVTKAPDAGPPPDPCAPSPCVVVAAEPDGGCVVDVVPGCADCITAMGERGTSRDGGSCCGGCWAGPVCRERPDALACGAGGELCVSCVGSQVCARGKCTFGP